MQNTLGLTYEGCTKVKRNELSLIVHQYEFFNMEENKLKTYKICLVDFRPY